MAFAALIAMSDQPMPREVFFPSRSPMWPKMCAALALVQLVEAAQ